MTRTVRCAHDPQPAARSNVTTYAQVRSRTNCAMQQEQHKQNTECLSRCLAKYRPQPSSSPRNHDMNTNNFCNQSTQLINDRGNGNAQRLTPKEPLEAHIVQMEEHTL
jgi:hypothetical protein